jgi:hypothetical protein
MQARPAVSDMPLVANAATCAAWVGWLPGQGIVCEYFVDGVRVCCRCAVPETGMATLDVCKRGQLAVLWSEVCCS